MNKQAETNGGPAPGGEFAGATPGPWLVCEPYTNRAVFPIGHDRDDGAVGILAEVNSQGGTPEQCSANARLIAAAPALLAERDAARAESRSLAASLDAAQAELKQRTAERDQACRAITGLLRHCVTLRGFPEVGKGRTPEQQVAFDAARAALGAERPA